MSQKIFYLFLSGILICFSVKSQAPVAGFTLSANSGCLTGAIPVFPVTCTSTTTGNPAPTLSWDFGDGTGSSSSSSHSYTKAGTFTITLTATNINGTDIATQTVNIYAQPVVAFTGTPVSGCFPLKVQFTDNSTTSSGTINSWNWDFGDGNISTSQNPLHKYIDAGMPGPVLTVTNSNGCKATLQKLLYINIANGVKADFFSNSASTGCATPIQVTFTDNTTGGAPGISYKWNFGDGTAPVTTQNPVHNYNATGSFLVTLVSTSAAGCTDTVQHPVTLNPTGIVSDFIAPDSACINTVVNFQNASTPPPNASNWNFGDGTTSINTNPQHTYTTAKTYVVTLTNTFGTCTNVISKIITVTPIPKANFKSDVSGGCQAPLTVNFSDLSLNGTHWRWDFGDGTPVSTSPNPTHTYTQLGSYTVKLVTSNASGCVDSLTKTNYIQIVKPTLKITNLPFNGCIPLSFTPVQNNIVPDGIASYSWDFGDGGTSSSATPTHVYTVAGKYPVKLQVVTNGGCTANFVDTVHAGTNKPTAAFTASPTTVCTGTAVKFTDHSSSNTNQWLYVFGDGGNSSLANPSHTFGAPGTFHVKLIAYDDGCNDSAFQTIVVNPPGASFIFKGNCTNKNQITFTDKSIMPLTWSWDFADGSPPSAMQNPVHDFPTVPGVYGVRLSVTNGACVSAVRLNVAVIYDKADFTVVPSSCKNEAVTFTAINSIPADISSYTWDFGDGQKQVGSGLGTVHHVYANIGDYNVKLAIRDINGCIDSIKKSVRINGPKAAFTATNISGCKGLSPVFTDQSLTDGTNPITSWTWNFGDGTVQSFSGPPFTHVYNVQGVYSVTLKVTDAGGCFDSLIVTNLVTVSIPNADFSAIDSGCVGNPVKFTNVANGVGLTYNWYFGDGAVSGLATPTHAYAATGQYTVALKITDIYGCHDSVGKNNYITIGVPKASFTMSASSTSCPPLQVDFKFTGSYYKSVKWLFGDGNTSTLLDPTHSFVMPGVFTVTLIATSPGGCTDTARNTITVYGPSGVLNYNPLTGCSPLLVNFDIATSGVVKYTWDFNDGNTLVTTVPTTSHIYTNPDTLRPQITLQDAAGCTVLVEGPQNIIVQGSVPDFGNNIDSLCQSGTIQFSDSTKAVGTISKYNWFFGDGGVSTSKNPSYFYSSPGLYSVKLRVTTQAGCQDSVTQVNLVKVFANPVIDITGANSGCVPDTLHLQAVILQPDTLAFSWEWDFFNGTLSTFQSPPDQIYPVPGNDSLQLITTSAAGCKDTVKKFFTVYPLPIVNAGIDTTICLTNNAQLVATGAATYNWLPPDNSSLSCSNCPNPMATPAVTTSYIVNGASSFGCQALDTVTVSVLSPQTITVSPPDSICKGQSVTLMATGNTEFQWMPASGLSSTSVANPVASPDTTTIYQVVGTDNLHCFTDTQYVKISVFDYPTITVSPHAVTVPVGSSVSINGSGSPDIVSILWTPASGMIGCTDCFTPVAQPAKSITYTAKVVNNGGCEASDSINIVVTCTNNNIFIPNTFSPNGDGVNDYFFIQGKGLTRIQSMRIFNRWGQMIFEKKDFLANTQTSGWDGNFNGKPAGVDVYIYTVEVICENSAVVPVHGNVALIR